MPVEPLTIITSTVALATAAIVTVRNGISQILEDHDTVKHRHESLIPTAIRLTLLFHDISFWRESWQIYDGVPASLPIAYWGSPGHHQIERLLMQIHAKSAQLLQEFESNNEDVVQRETSRNTDIMGRGSVDTFYERQMLSSLQQKRKELYRRLKGAGRAIFTEPLFQDHLENLEKWIKLLQRSSKEFFVENMDKSKEIQWATQRSSLQVESHLIRCANDHFRAYTILQEFLVNRDGLIFDLHLGADIEASRHLEHLAKLGREQSLELRLRTRNLYDRNHHGIEVLCKLPHELDISTLREVLVQQFMTVVGHTTCAQSEPCGLTTSPVQRASPSYDLWELRSDHDLYNDGAIEAESLRSFMNRHQDNFDEFLHGPFSKKERHRLAYELAEWTLIFLKTEWFAELCSCRIFRVETDNLKTTFCTRVGSVEHINTTTDPLQRERQWCQVELYKMHICRLGVLLLEIAIGSPVPDLAFHKKFGIEIDGELDLMDVDATPVLRRKDINRKVLGAMGQKFMNVVDYCLQKRSLPQEITESDICDFYEHAVKPLFLYYHKLYVEAPERQKQVEAEQE